MRSNNNKQIINIGIDTTLACTQSVSVHEYNTHKRALQTCTTLCLVHNISKHNIGLQAQQNLLFHFRIYEWDTRYRPPVTSIFVHYAKLFEYYRPETCRQRERSSYLDHLCYKSTDIDTTPPLFVSWTYAVGRVRGVTRMPPPNRLRTCTSADSLTTC